jgi:hypothetical protein
VRVSSTSLIKQIWDYCSFYKVSSTSFSSKGILCCLTKVSSTSPNMHIWGF